MLVHWIRHGESLANAGSSDDPDSGLSPLGWQQAERLADRLAPEGPAAVFSSPFRRALETACPLAERLALPVYVRAELAEYFTADLVPGETFALLHWDQLRAAFPFVRPDPRQSELCWPDWPETLDQLVRRQQRFVREIKHRWADTEDTLVVFSHGAPTARAVEAWLTDQPGPEFRYVIANATVQTLRCAAGVSSLLCLNESSHLDGLPLPPWRSYAPRWPLADKPTAGPPQP